MFGVFLRESATTVFVLINKLPFKTELQFLNKENYSDLPDLIPGCKIEFDVKSIKLAEYSDCENCHMPLIKNNGCPCPFKDIIAANG